MNKFFTNRCSNISLANITENQIKEYQSLLVEEMLKLGASQEELTLIHKQTIVNAIYNNVKPEDVAWAILQ